MWKKYARINQGALKEIELKLKKPNQSLESINTKQ